MSSRRDSASSVRSIAAVVNVALAALAVPFAVGCAGSAPLLHPAHTLPKGDISGTFGISTNFAVGEVSDAIAVARDQAVRSPEVPGPPGTNPTYAKGAISLAAIAPGMSPVVGARVGLGNNFEGGLVYTGRGARIDGRRSFDLGSDFAFSIGLGFSSAFYGRQPNTGLPNVDLEALRGIGADVPLLFGWKSQSELVMAWFGARGGIEYDTLEVLSSEPKTFGPTSPLQLSATRVFGGGVVGFATGFKRVHVALEVSAYYQSVSGTYNANSVSLSGLTLSPASALIFSF